MNIYHEETNRGPRNKQIADFIKSITNLENAFANILNEEAEFLRTNRNRFTADEFMQFNEDLEEILKLVIKKEIILEFLLDEIKKCPKECPDDREEHEYDCRRKKYHCECEYVDDHVCYRCHKQKYVWDEF